MTTVCLMAAGVVCLLIAIAERLTDVCPTCHRRYVGDWWEYLLRCRHCGQWLEGRRR